MSAPLPFLFREVAEVASVHGPFFPCFPIQGSGPIHGYSGPEGFIQCSHLEVRWQELSPGMAQVGHLSGLSWFTNISTFRIRLSQDQTYPLLR